MLALILSTALAVTPAPAVANPTMQGRQASAATLQAEPASTQGCPMPSMSGSKADPSGHPHQYSTDGRH